MTGKKKSRKIGKIIGYVGMYIIFTIILYFVLYFLHKLPETWNFLHIIMISLFIVLLGTLIKLLLK